MRVALIVGIFITLLILFVPFKVKVKVSYDALKNNGVVAFKLGFVTLFVGKLKVSFNKLIVNYAKDKTYITSITNFKNSNNFTDNFLINIYDAIKVNTFKLYANIGYKEDAFVTAMIVGCIDVPIGVALGWLKNKKPRAKVVSCIYPSFITNKLFVGVSSSVSISLFVVVSSFVKSVLKISGGNKNG